MRVRIDTFTILQCVQYHLVVVSRLFVLLLLRWFVDDTRTRRRNTVLPRRSAGIGVMSVFIGSFLLSPLLVLFSLRSRVRLREGINYVHGFRRDPVWSIRRIIFKNSVFFFLQSRSVFVPR